MKSGLISLLYQVAVSGHYLFFLLRYLSWGRWSQQRAAQQMKLGLVRPQLNEKAERFWVHAVSAGEVKLAAVLIDALKAARQTPRAARGLALLLTTTSRSGFEMAQLLYQKEPLVSVAYLPLDFLPLAQRWCRALQPKRVFVIEHDFWPNLLRAARRYGGERIFLNHQLKPREQFFYQRFPSVLRFTHQSEIILTQTKAGALFLRQQLKTTTVEALGNLKALALLKNSSPNRSALAKRGGGTWLARLSSALKCQCRITLGSSHEGEEQLLLAALRPALQQEGLGLQVTVLPRHKERGLKLKKSLAAAGFKVELYSRWKKKALGGLVTSKQQNRPSRSRLGVAPQVLIVDEMGLSEVCYRLSDLVLIGDSFLPSKGGHNFLEGLAQGVATAYGSYFASYEELTPQLEQAGAVVRLPSALLSQALLELVNNRKKRLRLAENGKRAFIKLRAEAKALKGRLAAKGLWS